MGKYIIFYIPEARGKNLSADEFPKPIIVQGNLWLKEGVEGEIVCVHGSMCSENMSVIDEVEEKESGLESMVRLGTVMEKPVNQRVYCVLEWNYSVIGRDWKPVYRITLMFGTSERLTFPLDVDTDNDVIPDGNDSEPFTPAELPESPFADNDG
ncbi:MAG: hypothetical protein ACP5LE_08350, partial [Thermoplasmata archaeon]